MPREISVTLVWLAVGAAGFALLPWYMLQDSVLSLGWLRDFASRDNAPALLQAALHGRWWLWPIGALLRPRRDRAASRPRATHALDHPPDASAASASSTAWPGFRDRRARIRVRIARAGVRPLPAGQFGMGLGAALVLASFVMLFSLGLALRGFFKGDGVRRRKRRLDRRAGRAVHVLPRDQDPAVRAPVGRRRAVAVGVRDAAVHGKDLGPRLPRRRHALRRRVEHAARWRSPARSPARRSVSRSR